MPGGKIEFKETPLNARQREILEETGIEIAIDQFQYITKIFIHDALAYLRDRPSAKSGYLLCFGQNIEVIKQMKNEKQGFGAHIKKAISFNDCFRSTWELNPLPKDQVKVIATFTIQQKKKKDLRAQQQI